MFKSDWSDFVTLVDDKNSYAQEQMDIKVMELLEYKKDGVFVEYGAYDGLFQSNTKYMEEYYNWSGLLIEPIKKYYDYCCYNRSCVVENFIISENYNKMSDIGTMSKIIKEFDNNCDVKNCSLNFLFDKYKLNHIDFMSVDVEGYELDTLKTVDLNKYNIDYILVEVNNNEYIITDYLKNYGYIFHSYFNSWRGDVMYKKMIN